MLGTVAAKLLRRPRGNPKKTPAEMRDHAVDVSEIPAGSAQSLVTPQADHKNDYRGKKRKADDVDV